MSEKEAKHIKHYYCQRCKEEDPTLQTVFRAIPAAVPGIPIEDRTNKMLKKLNKDKTRNKPPKAPKVSKDRCGVCTGCLAQNCGRCAGCAARKAGNRRHRCIQRTCAMYPHYQPTQSKRERPPPVLFANVAATNYPPIDATNGPQPTPPPQPLPQQHPILNAAIPVVSSAVVPTAATTAHGPKPKRRRRTPSPEVFINPDLQGVRQCYGPTCRMTARPQSKYCSDECGKRLATNRIYRVLPQRIQEWNLSVCKAEEQNKRMLDTVRAKQATVRATLAELEKRHKELDLLVERAKRCTLDPRASDQSDVEDEMSMYCITCGHEIHSKTAIRHMEKCFNKYESQASFGSIFKTRIEGNSMFCDFYNAASKTYCKRLRVVCPEHCKDAKVNDTDVCGCPLVRNTFELTGEFCRAPKKNCFRHYVWEKIRRAEIDLERVRQWLKMDELMEQERHVRTAMASRAGVLGLMLHSTYNHVIMEKLCRNAAAANGTPQQ